MCILLHIHVNVRNISHSIQDYTNRRLIWIPIRLIYQKEKSHHERFSQFMLCNSWRILIIVAIVKVKMVIQPLISQIYRIFLLLVLLVLLPVCLGTGYHWSDISGNTPAPVSTLQCHSVTVPWSQFYTNIHTRWSSHILQSELWFFILWFTLIILHRNVTVIFVSS